MRRRQPIHDTQLDVECNFQTASDGVERCLPDESGDAMIFYEDAACEENPVLALRSSCDLGVKYAVETKLLEGCGPSSENRVFARAEELTRPDLVYYRIDDACSSTAALNFEFFYDLVEVDPTTFVEAKREIVPGTEELGTEMLVASDGFRRPVGAYDPKREQSCELLQVDDDEPFERHCLSRFADREARASRDDQCSEPLASIEKGEECGAPDLVVGEREGQCGAQHLFEVGRRVSAAWVPNLIGECVPNEDLTLSTYAIGAPKRAGEYASAVLEPFDSRRVSPFGVRSRGTWLFQTELWDSAFEAPCRPIRLPDDKVYCVPDNAIHAAGGYNFYGDDACSVPLYERPSGNCAPFYRARLFAEFAFPVEGCPVVEFDTFYEAVPFEGEVIYLPMLGDECEPQPRDPTLSYYTKGHEVRAEDVFVELE